MMRALFSILVAAAGVSLDRWRSGDLHDTWIAYDLKDGHGTRYFNPSQDRSVSALPPGAKEATPHVAMLQGGAKGVDEPSWDGDCAPKCSWECKHTECEKECKPVCDMPKCQTRCKNPDLGQCKVKCSSSPRCATFCPPQQPCNQRDAHGHRLCHKPDCATKCEKAQCALVCGDADTRTCRNVCAEPKCSWSCRDPKVCPKPLCRLTCSRSNCSFAHTSFQLPALSADQQVMSNFTARKADPFSVGPWSECDCGTGKQYREVKCESKLNVCGPGATPATSRQCATPCKGYYEFTEWSKCKGECFGHGYKHREGTCVKGDCGGIKTKREVERCEYDSSRCHMCEATVYGGAAWDDWSSTFQIGSFDERAMRDRNIKCEDVSSLKVKGFCCSVRLYQYGDFNHGDSVDGAWRAMYSEGNYNKEDLESKGGFDNQASSLEVFVDQDCVQHAKYVGAREDPRMYHRNVVAPMGISFLIVVALW